MNGGGLKKNPCYHHRCHDRCMVMRCKQWNKTGLNCSCKHEENSDRSSYKFLVAGDKFKLARSSYTINR